MTEGEWLTSTDPKAMLDDSRGNASHRKLRLFACACCRRVWDWLDEKGRRAIETSERYWDGRASYDDLCIAMSEAAGDYFGEFGTHYPSNAAYCATSVVDIDSYQAAVAAATEVAEAVRCEANVRQTIVPGGSRRTPDSSGRTANDGPSAGETARMAECAAQCDLLRDIFRGPRRPIHIRGHWRSASVFYFARTIYEDRAFHVMPMLGDALEEAGCDEIDILNHCRQPGGHVRGCWVIDALLLKS